jgi:hypothetical protein
MSDGVDTQKTGLQIRLIVRVTAQRAMKRDIGWVLAAKFAALGLLRCLFFSPGQEPIADSAATGRHIVAAPSIEHPAHLSPDRTSEKPRD